MNTLVYKYGETAKTNNVKLDIAVLNDTTSTNKDKEMAGSITNIVSGNLSASVNVDGTTCNDGNALTIGETYLNGICQGGATLNITANGLYYDNCEGGLMILQNAITYCTKKGMRIPDWSEISATTGLVPGCSDMTWTTAYQSNNAVWVWKDITNTSSTYNFFENMVRCVK